MLSGLADAARAAPWPAIQPESLAPAAGRPWLLRPVYERIYDGKSGFLAELRPVAALFLRFGGIDYDGDEQAGANLDRFVRWVQMVLARYDGSLLQVTIGDKGSYLYMVVGAPVAHEDDPKRAVAAALDLHMPPADLEFIRDVQIGVAYGDMRTGSYGSPSQHTYGVQGDKANLAARLMQEASGGILCDVAVAQAAQVNLRFEALPPIKVKGKAQAVPIYRPVAQTFHSAINSRIDQARPAEQLTLKVASVIGPVFGVTWLRAIYPIQAEQPRLEAYLAALEQHGLVVRRTAEDGAELSYKFSDGLTRDAAYSRLLFAQRRQLHRAAAEWYERTNAADLAPHYALLAHHWSKAEDRDKSIYYLEQAGNDARLHGAYEKASTYFNGALALDAGSAGMSTSAPGDDLDREYPLLGRGS